MPPTPNKGFHAGGRRIDIDILRAIAVLSVIFFHFDVPGFSGGFLGVDIFFVISGYLITLHIQQQTAQSSFNFTLFYLRRIRRLYPVLISALAMTSLAALFILPHTLIQDFAKSQVASSVYASNIYFWLIANYFDTDAILKPLLHTWSLSVEEQFYVIWPLFVYFTYKRRPEFWVLGIGLTSLMAAELFWSFSASATFYLFPFRIFEFAAGALMCRNPFKSLPQSAKTSLFLLSITSVLASLLLSSELSRNPGLSTLPLCLGTAFVIGLRHPWLNQLNPVTRIALRIGLISYSAYLVHWPLVVFYKVYFPQPLDIYAIGKLLAATYLLSEVLYNFIEKPGGSINLKKYRLAIFSLVPLFFVASLIYQQATPSLYRKLNPDEFTVRYALDNIPDRKEELKKAQLEVEKRQGNHPGAENVQTILVTGDSHSEDVFHALSLYFAGTNVQIMRLGGICDPLTANSIAGITLKDLYEDAAQEKTRDPEYCRRHHQEFLGKLVEISPDLIVFSEAWRESALPFLGQSIADIKTALTADILILGRNPQFSPHPNVVFRNFESIEDINERSWQRRYRIFDDFDSILAGVADQTDSDFISKNELVCPDKKCKLLIDNEFGYTDSQHWSLVGMNYYGRLLASDKAFTQFR